MARLSSTCRKPASSISTATTWRGERQRRITSICSIRQDILAEQRFGDAGAKQVGDLGHHGRRAAGSRPNQDSDLGACIQYLRRAREIGGLRDDDRMCIAGARAGEAVRLARLLIFRILYVLGQHDG